MKKHISINIGQFEIRNGKVTVSDPCYKKGTWCAGTLSGVEKGEWNAKIVQSDEKDWGKRVSLLVATHKDFDPENYFHNWHVQDFEVGVDSGQAGIFDSKDFHGGNDDEWYKEICNLTHPAGICKGGVCSNSGYGDGCYTCLTTTNPKNGKIVGIMIDFFLISRKEI